LTFGDFDEHEVDALASGITFGDFDD
nr:Chain C, NON-STRUCTURAL PROTEIN 3 [Semliki Forest virus]